MVLSELFNKVMDLYPHTGTKVDSTSDVYSVLCRSIPELISKILNKDYYDVVGSMGQGNKTSYPWVSILNTRVTRTTQRGIYMVFLFKKDLSGFYLSLNQGITFFEQRYKSERYKHARRVADYFRNEITDTSFSSEPIDLGSDKKDLGYGYCQTSIISKWYFKNNFSSEMLIADLIELSGIYDEIVAHMGSDSYEAIIEKILDTDDDTFVILPEAIEMIRKIVDPNNEMPRDLVRKVHLVNRPIIKRKYKKLSAPSNKKVDYIKKAQNDLKYGLMGEELVLEYEKDRMRSLGKIDLVDSVKWASKESDSFGYDIQSFDMVNGKIVPIYIEVKTTSSPVDVDFFVSVNELEKSKELADSYYVYRIYDVNSTEPQMYRAKGEITKNFILDPVTFRARYKYPALEYEPSQRGYSVAADSGKV